MARRCMGGGRRTAGAMTMAAHDARRQGPWVLVHRRGRYLLSIGSNSRRVVTRQQ